MGLVSKKRIRYFILLFIFLSLINITNADIIWPGSSWVEVSPESVGMDSAKLIEARDYALTAGGSGYIIRDGRIAMKWGSETTLYNLLSTTKSIGVTALGLAIKDGLVDLDDTAQSIYSDFGRDPYNASENVDTGWLDDITLFHLATQTAGFDKPGGYSPLLFEHGTAWAYSDCGPNWLADCLTLSYSEDLNNIMFNRIFSYMDLSSSDYNWRDNNYRIVYLSGDRRREFGSGISANVDFMARIGYLYLRGGEWDGNQIIDTSFVNQVSSAQVAGLPVMNDPDSIYGGSPNHYGLLWWNNVDGAMNGVPTDAYWSWGAGDSFIIVIPSLDIVAVRAGPAGNTWEDRGWDPDYDVLRNFIKPIVDSIIPGSDRELLSHLTMDSRDISGNTINDQSDYNNDGTMYGSPDVISGRVDNAIALDSTEYVRVGTDSSLDNLAEFSYSAWINPSSGGDREIFSRRGSYRELRLRETSPLLRGCVQTSGPTCSNSVADSISLDIWQFVTMTYDNNGDRMVHLYIDGNEVSYSQQDTGSGSLASVNSYNQHIGVRYSPATTNYDRYFEGAIDDVRIYDYALSSSEVLNLYDSYDQSTPPHEADTNEDGVISNSELWAFIDLWKDGTATLARLVEALKIWNA